MTYAIVAYVLSAVLWIMYLLSVRLRLDRAKQDR
jgi:hypothetical protein